MQQSDVSETVDRSIEAATLAQNEQQLVDNKSKETSTHNPPQNQKTRSLREIYEDTPVSDEHLQYALFHSHPRFFEEAVKDAQWVHANEEVNENDEVASIDEQHQDVNVLEEELKYIHIFSNKNFQGASKDDIQKNHVETEEEDLHYVPKAEEDIEEQLLSVKIQKTKKKKSKYTSRKKVKLKFLNEM